MDRHMPTRSQLLRLLASPELLRRLAADDTPLPARVVEEIRREILQSVKES